MTPTSPPLVATLRGIFLAALSAAILVVINSVSDPSNTQLVTYAPLIVAGLRIVEGFIDKARGQAPQTGLGGSHPAT